MAKVNLYRNISVSFIVFTALLLTAIFLLFYSRTTVTIFTNEQEVDLNFVAELKENPTADELAEKDVITGKLLITEKTLTGEFQTAGVKTVSSDMVGRVEIINNSNRNQTLLKTTQLQALNGVIVRTGKQVTVPAGGRVAVDVYPKSLADFREIGPGNLTIIKLNENLQSLIYGVNAETMKTGVRQVRILAADDISQAQEKLLGTMVDENRVATGLEAKNGGLIFEVIKAETDKKIDEETDRFTLTLTVKVKELKMDREQFLALIGKKIKNLNLTGLEARSFDFTNLAYAVLDENFNGNVLIKINYSVKAKISVNNPFLSPSHLVGKNIDEAKSYLEGNDLIKKAEIVVTPYWQKSLPKQEKKIKVIVQ